MNTFIHDYLLGSRRRSRTANLRGLSSQGIPIPIILPWYREGDLNPQGFLRWVLSPVRLPISPSRLYGGDAGIRTRVAGLKGQIPNR